jgi:hypothetical protein
MLKNGVALVRTDVSEELGASFIRVTKIGDLGTTLAVTSNRCTLQRNTISSLVHSQMPISGPYHKPVQTQFYHSLQIYFNAFI